MRKNITLVIISVLQGLITPQLSLAQSVILEERTTIKFENESVVDALNRLSDQTGYVFSYVNSKTNKSRRVTRSFVNAPLKEIIRFVWGKGQIRLSSLGSTIEILVVEKKEKEFGSLQGSIKDDNKEPVPFATVAIKGTNRGVITDEKGYFEIKGIPEGTHMLAISSMGYEPREKKILIRPSQTTSISIEVSVAVKALDEVVVEGRSQEVKELVQSAQAVTVLETRIAKVQTADLGEVVTRTQGVNIQRTGGLGSDAQFSLNGLTNDQIRFFLNGIPLTAMGYTNGLANIPVNLIDRVEIYRGVVPVRFGADALGGAVNIISNEAFNGTGGSFSYQAGSFGTHRLALTTNHQPEDKDYFVNLATFYDRAKNNYKVDVEVPDNRGRISDVTVERFHDDYLARGVFLDAGFRNKKWADLFTARFFYSKVDKDLQHNFTMDIPYGATIAGFTSRGGLVKWEKSWNEKISIENTVGLSENENFLLDTASVIYNWDGQLSRDLNGEIIIKDPIGERGSPSDATFIDQLFYDRFNIQYKLAKGHDLRLSSAPGFESRTGKNALLELGQVDRLSLENKIFTFINGLEYEYNSSNDKLNLITFMKRYTQYLNTERINNAADEVINVTEQDRETNNVGYGVSIRYRFNPKWQLKTSYERATRLPNLKEVFGDGIFLLDNIDLLPERSNNVNLSVAFNTYIIRKSPLKIDLNTFIRQVEGLIVLIGSGNFFFYQNIADATSRGAEMEADWTSTNGNLNITINGTYVDYINTSDKGLFAPFKGDRIPNLPFFFSSASTRYVFDGFTSAKDNLTLFTNLRHVNQFFRTWESAGRRDTKQVISGQFTQNIGATYSTRIGKKKLDITGEIQNLSNEKVFDFFGVQRPGRAFYLKANLNF